MPVTVEVTTCSIFIASITATCWPPATGSPSATASETIVPCSGAATAMLLSGPVTVATGTLDCHEPPGAPGSDAVPAAMA